MTAVSAVLVALALWLWTAPDASAARLRRLTRPRDSEDTAVAPGVIRAFRKGTAVLRGRSREADLPSRWRAASIELCHGLGAELAAGRSQQEALARALTWVDLPSDAAARSLAAAARDGGDIPAALVAIAPEAGGDGLRRLAACWQVSSGVGTGLAALVDRVEATLRAAQNHRHEVAAQLAGPRATARLLAALPLLGLLMGVGLGMDPLGFLLGGPAGFGCLLVGLALDACGLWWTNRLVVRAEQA